MAIASIARIEGRHSSLRQLVELGREKGYLLFDEIQEQLSDDVMASPEELDEVFQRLYEAGLEVIERPVRYISRDALDSGAGDFEKKDGVAEYQLRDHEKTGDPVRMYLREMGTVPLLDRDGEVEIARHIEHGEWLVYEALCENPAVLRELLRLNELDHDGNSSYGKRSEKAEAALEDAVKKRIEENVQIFERLRNFDAQVEKLSTARRMYGVDQDESLEIDREIDRLAARISDEIRKVDFSLHSRNRIVDVLKDIDREFSHNSRDLNRAESALKQETNKELQTLHKRRIAKYRKKQRGLEKRYYQKRRVTFLATRD